MKATELIVTIENRCAAHNGHKDDVRSIVFGLEAITGLTPAMAGSMATGGGRCAGLIAGDNGRRCSVCTGRSCGSTAKTIGCIQCGALVHREHAGCDG